MAGEYAPAQSQRELSAEQVSNPARDLLIWGVAQRAEQVALTHSVVGSNPIAPAIYVDNESGSVVPETWWPGDPAPIITEN